MISAGWHVDTDVADLTGLTDINQTREKTELSRRRRQADRQKDAPHKVM